MNSLSRFFFISVKTKVFSNIIDELCIELLDNAGRLDVNGLNRM